MFGNQLNTTNIFFLGEIEPKLIFFKIILFNLFSKKQLLNCVLCNTTCLILIDPSVIF